MKKSTENSTVRFSVSLPAKLLDDLDRMTVTRGQASRSAAMADMIRERLVEQRQQLGNEEMAGTITLIYDHHKRLLQQTLTAIQHDHHSLIVSTTHVHLDHSNCLEVLILRGKGREIRRIADALVTAKGVRHGRLTIAATRRDLAR
jgi:CopG family transcriptional regulator, nickel-responsive regulator